MRPATAAGGSTPCTPGLPLNCVLWCLQLSYGHVFQYLTPQASAGRSLAPSLALLLLLSESRHLS